MLDNFQCEHNIFQLFWKIFPDLALFQINMDDPGFIALMKEYYTVQVNLKL